LTRQNLVAKNKGLNLTVNLPRKILGSPYSVFVFS
jgi:hypothetical protein